MDKETIDRLQKTLQIKKEALEKELSRFATKDPKLKGDWDTKYPRIPEGNLEEAASEVEEYSTSLPIEHSLELQLKGVNSALEQIQKGTYGICEACGKEISQERLFAFPEAKTCEACNQ
ncbi:MAG: transcriptional regulator TraR/DksA family [Parcubacteria group bacterium Greene0714_21]|nr:MAG: transcriptional regulator TraR/DksA family [Parcubacteria group bacterium Greene0416_39]TSC98366.1 MAG: transcriptional regulator TraR/DksA family [Parcubacteria group bacterium Greene1014_47]TSD04017.1 MAG: transcriptional regulator TraR/DksA family [Parcubacteria group bacterium Greene0714_21]